MGQVRDRFVSDAQGLTEWFARKIKNHDPMSQRDSQSDRKVFTPTYANQRGNPVMRKDVPRVAHVDDNYHVDYNLGNGKRFRCIIVEIDENDKVIDGDFAVVENAQNVTDPEAKQRLLAKA